MENPLTHHSKTTPKDFFLWAGAVIALYGSVISVIALLFEYINRAYPDTLGYAMDPYGGLVRAAMAGVIVLVPTALILINLIRKTIKEEAGKEHIWVRRWALVLTIFIAVVVMLIDLITLITTFLGGDLSIRFALKVAVVLLVAGFVFMHFLADLKGYWLKNSKKADLISFAVLLTSVAMVVAGFFIIGTPTDIRMLRHDEQKVYDLQGIQYQVLNYYQQKGALPATLTDLNDPLSSFMVPKDPESKEEYVYRVTGPLTFELCGVFNKATLSDDSQMSMGGAGYPGIEVDENWEHTEGETCFTRTIDPERYPLFERSLR